MRHQHQRHVRGILAQQTGLAGFVASAFLHRQQRLLALDALDDALDHLLQVELALTQVGVLHLVELARQPLELGGQGPAGVVETVRDPVAHAAEDLVVLQQHHVHFQQCRQLSRHFLGHGGQQQLDFLHHIVARRMHPGDFCLDLFRLDEIVPHIGAAGRNHHRAPDGDAAAHPYAVDRYRHPRILTRLRRICR